MAVFRIIKNINCTVMSNYSSIFDTSKPYPFASGAAFLHIYLDNFSPHIHDKEMHYVS